MEDQENRKSQWLWFIGLYIAGLSVTALVAWSIRYLLTM